MTGFRSTGAAEVEVLPTKAAELWALRATLTSRKTDIVAALSKIAKSDGRRPPLVDESTVIDRKLRRVNAALAAANRAEQGAVEPPVVMNVEEARYEAALTSRQEAAVRVACALLAASPSAFVKPDGVDAATLAEEAWDVVNHVTMDAPEDEA